MNSAALEQPPPELWPLHPEQRRILHAQARAPESSKYNVGGYVRMLGPFDAGAFEEALRLFWHACDAERMEILRTTGAPRQQFHADAEMPPPERLDFRGLPDGAERALAWMQARMDEAMGMGRFPLFEHAALAIGPRETWYFARHHHIVADAYAFSLKISEVLRCYAALVGGGAAPEPRLGSYRAEIADALGYLSSSELTDDLGYWAQRLASPPPPLWPHRAAATDAAMQAGTMEQAEIAIDGPMRERMLEIVTEARVSLLHVLMGCVAVHLSGTEGPGDLVVGVPVHNRSKLRQKRTFGVMSAIVPTRLAADRSLPFAQIAQQAAIGLAHDLAHRHVPLWEIIKQARAAPGGRRDLFEIILNYEPFAQTPAAGELTVTTHELSSGMEHIPLHIRLCDFGAHQPLALRVQMMNGLAPGGAAAFAEDLQRTMAALLAAQPVTAGTSPHASTTAANQSAYVVVGA